MTFNFNGYLNRFNCQVTFDDSQVVARVHVEYFERAVHDTQCTGIDVRFACSDFGLAAGIDYVRNNVSVGQGVNSIHCVCVGCNRCAVVEFFLVGNNKFQFLLRNVEL